MPSRNRALAIGTAVAGWAASSLPFGGDGGTTTKPNQFWLQTANIGKDAPSAAKTVLALSEGRRPMKPKAPHKKRGK